MNKPSWDVRRRVVVATLLFCAFCVTYIMIWGGSRSVEEVIVFSAFGLALSVIGSYIFGAVWDDKNVMKELGPAAYIKTPDPDLGNGDHHRYPERYSCCGWTSRMIALWLPRLLGILTFGLTIPVWLILAVGLWVTIDKGSAVRHAVDRAVTELVAGAELEAAQAKVQALEKINATLTGKAVALEAANSRFSTSLLEAQNDLETANEQLSDLLANPVSDTCTVDGLLDGRLRSK